MSAAELLRRAAQTLRERAEGAQHTTAWCPDYAHVAIRHVQRNCDLDVDFHCTVHGDRRGCGMFGMYDGAYIALMHPPVALALADWLEATAESVEANDAYDGFDLHMIDDTYHGALTTARAVLREGPS
jgi:hypothetical protein